MAKQVTVVPFGSKDGKVTTVGEAADSWKSIGELAASIVRGTAK